MSNTNSRTANAIKANQLKRQQKLAFDLRANGWFVAPPHAEINHPQLFPEWTVTAEQVQEALAEWARHHA